MDTKYRVIIAMFAIGVLPLGFFTVRAFSTGPQACRSGIKVATWNVAAVNNNPFEYWITHKDPAYNKLMDGVQDYIANSGARDVPVKQIITESMAKQLFEDMSKKGIPQADVDQVAKRWISEYQNRKVVSEFMKDKDIGKKRLASMPDRVTNTINLADGGVALRPTVINCYDGDLSTIDAWWTQWREFFFVKKIALPGKGGAAPTEKLVADMLQPIKNAKYPAITPEEEAISIPLQMLAMAIFDGILVHMLNDLDKSTWQPIRKEVCEALNKNKDNQILSILSTSYRGADIIFLQETATVFKKKLVMSEDVGSRYMLLSPSNADGKRDQNSIMLLNKKMFRETPVEDITDKVIKKMIEEWAAPGDLVVTSVESVKGVKFLLASFHGDTNGLATKPVVSAVLATWREAYSDHKLIMGLDGNTYKVHNEDFQGVEDFNGFLKKEGLASCWEPAPNPLSPTTCNARTYLQTQLNKAIAREDRLTKGDVNLKDWIIFSDSEFSADSTTKDNTGEVKYIEEMVFPTLSFPSDHAVVSTTLLPTTEAGCVA